MSIAYTPTPGSAAHRVCSFFADNPDETLTKDDLCTKFGLMRPSIPGLLDRAFRAKFIRMSSPDTYMAGDEIDAFAAQLRNAEHQPAAATHAVAPAAAPAPAATSVPAEAVAEAQPLSPPARTFKVVKQAKRLRLPLLDVTSIQVQTGVPIPPASNGQPGQGRYIELFDKLTEVGQHIELPIEYRGTVGKAVVPYQKKHRPGRKLVVRTIDATADQPARVGIWRTA